MDEPKTNKRVSNSNDSFLGSKDKAKKPTSNTHYEYRFDEQETTALDTVYGYLFDKLTEVSQGNDP
ncbi:TPA: hypothetical protein DIV49_01195 [Candidatus Saccharibacteria bacterium]|jgi:hypothetical protein|nr:hypothetical protein [Candidatus Saccharibacteria bacterium]HRJ91253.1 hypothetical protein [Candidatus Saccharibacteria bacterium]